MSSYNMETICSIIHCNPVSNEVSSMTNILKKERNLKMCEKQEIPLHKYLKDSGVDFR